MITDVNADKSRHEKKDKKHRRSRRSTDPVLAEYLFSLFPTPIIAPSSFFFFAFIDEDSGTIPLAKV
jgi:hypothetical protein